MFVDGVFNPQTTSLWLERVLGEHNGCSFPCALRYTETDAFRFVTHHGQTRMEAATSSSTAESSRADSASEAASFSPEIIPL